MQKKAEFQSHTDRLSPQLLVPYVLITFGIAWTVLGLYLFVPGQMQRCFGHLSANHPLFFVAVWAPAAAAFAIIAFRRGLSGVKQFAASVTHYTCSFGWYLFLFAGIPVVFYAGAALKGTLFTDPLPVTGLIPVLTALGLSAIKGPIEEFGWRGFALPLLQRVIAPFWASLILGCIWGLWHLPAFFLSGTQQSAWSFTPFFIGTVSISVLATALFNASGGSILLSAALHFQLMNPLWPDAQPYDTWLLTAVAAVVIWANRKTMFARTGYSITAVGSTEKRSKNLSKH
jgi:membrane protease YdiL (CAAX protease family)